MLSTYAVALLQFAINLRHRLAKVCYRPTISLRVYLHTAYRTRCGSSAKRKARLLPPYAYLTCVCYRPTRICLVCFLLPYAYLQCVCHRPTRISKPLPAHTVPIGMPNDADMVHPTVLENWYGGTSNSTREIVQWYTMHCTHWGTRWSLCGRKSLRCLSSTITSSKVPDTRYLRNYNTQHAHATTHCTKQALSARQIIVRDARY